MRKSISRAWLARAGEGRRYRELPRFPATTRDIAFIAPQELTHERIGGVLREAREPLLVETRLFDVFSDPTGEKVARGEKIAGVLVDISRAGADTHRR